MRSSLRILPGAAALLGGLAWVVHALLLAVRPLGCVGGACFAGVLRHRESEDIAWLLLVAVLLLAAAAGVAARSGRARRRWTASLLLLLAGAALLVVGLFVNRGASDGSPLWWLHDSDTLGRLLPVAGAFAAGLALWGEASRRLALLFLGAAAVGLFVNVQDHRVLLDLPIGLAWVVLGVRTALSPPQPGKATPASVRQA
ncbi:hypothetical protein [Desertivibrio insolitus]|uniref:hypothetical protein n=1 Tax=Herbiconiux sp. SYSU D00978 TaxID=2812562 RepID=UPI001A95C0FC|nr:hypothetical protein [Herbiconiux sp. SYSU D00978]